MNELLIAGFVIHKQVCRYLISASARKIQRIYDSEPNNYIKRMG